MTAKTEQNQTPLIAQKWADLTKPTGKKWKNQSSWQRTCTTGRNVARMAGDTGRAVTGNRLARYIKGKSEQRKDSRLAASAERQRQRANRAAILEAYDRGGFVASDANGNIRYVGQRPAKVKEHHRSTASGTVTVAKGGMTKGQRVASGRKVRGLSALVALALFFVASNVARAQAEPCLITGGGEPPITVAASPQMNLADYHMLKSAMGHEDLMEHEFLKVLRGYCPNELRGVDKIDISLDHLPTVVILHESTAAAQRAAFATAQAETGAYTVYGDKPESGIGILYHANGWRLDTNGDWRSPTGGYAPTDPRHDPFQNMPDCWHTSTCNGPAPTASQTRGALLAARDYAVEVATGPTVIEASGPAPTAEPMVTNEFIEEPAGGFFGRVRWFASFCGTIVLIVVLVGLIALGVMAAGRLREQKREAEAEAGKYGLGVMAAQPRGVSS